MSYGFDYHRRNTGRSTRFTSVHYRKDDRLSLIKVKNSGFFFLIPLQQISVRNMYYYFCHGEKLYLK